MIGVCAGKAQRKRLETAKGEVSRSPDRVWSKDGSARELGAAIKALGLRWDAKKPPAHRRAGASWLRDRDSQVVGCLVRPNGRGLGFVSYDPQDDDVRAVA